MIILEHTGHGILYMTTGGHWTKSINQRRQYALHSTDTFNHLCLQNQLSISIAQSLHDTLSRQSAAYYVAFALQVQGPITSVIIKFSLSDVRG